MTPVPFNVKPSGCAGLDLLRYFHLLSPWLGSCIDW